MAGRLNSFHRYCRTSAMRNIALSVAAAASLAASVLSASAADIAPAPRYVPPPPPPIFVYNWTGFYVGGNLGGAWAC